ncbi:MAG: hypothetical protein ACFFDB_00490 [Promethearchaeota archaeon]
MTLGKKGNKILIKELLKDWILEFFPYIEERIVDDFLQAIKNDNVELERFFFIMSTGIYFEI